MRESIRVGMADYKICQPAQKIMTLGLGSCVGVVLYDTMTKWCGMAHMMLPDSSLAANRVNRMKYVDTCLSDMYEELLGKQVDPAHLVAKMAGGAKMFSHEPTNEFLNIGAQNYVAAVRQLAEFRIPVLAEDVGGTYSRTIEFDPASGMLHIKAAGIDRYVI